jgi:hypothetical protein
MARAARRIIENALAEFTGYASPAAGRSCMQARQKVPLVAGFERPFWLRTERWFVACYRVVIGLTPKRKNR